MDKATFNLQYCYGIASLNHEFDFSNNNMPVALYAPNGMMKTSLAKGVHDYVSGRKPQDKIMPERESYIGIADQDGNPIAPESIFVIDSINEKYRSERMSSLLASKDLKGQYDKIYKEIGDKRKQLVAKLKKFSGVSKDIESTFCTDFGVPIDGFFDALARLEREVKSDKYASFGSIKYKTIFNEKVAAFVSDPNFENLIEEYTNVYERIIDSSRYFKKGIFNHSNAEAIAKNLKTNGWFDGGHSVNLNDKSGKVEISTENELAAAIESEKEEILSNENLKKMFSKVDKAVSNAELKTFREYLIENPWLVPELRDTKFLRTKVWMGYLSSIKEDYLDLIECFDQSEEELKNIEAKAEAQQTRWEDVIGIFNSRFSVPFLVQIENKRDAVLNREAPRLVFYFNDEDCNPTHKVSRELLDGVLSNGEVRALYILNIIFEVEARREDGIETLFVIDDIADSFDYKNKYAIIEYLSEMRDHPQFRLLVMTHNFDFYRTVKGRLRIFGENNLVAAKQGNAIQVEKDILGHNPFKLWKKDLARADYLIASIPFVRNLAEYTGNTEAYETLTALLHIKPETASITLAGVKQVFSSVLRDGSDSVIEGSEDSVLSSLFVLCDEICTDAIESLQLEKKIVLSIGIRLRAELLLIERIDDQAFVDSISSNQTSKLVRRYIRDGDTDSNLVEALQQVSLMTPENIHLNSFMFEPILDMSMHHLCSLYVRLSEF